MANRLEDEYAEIIQYKTFRIYHHNHMVCGGILVHFFIFFFCVQWPPWTDLVCGNKTPNTKWMCMMEVFNGNAVRVFVMTKPEQEHSNIPLILSPFFFLLSVCRAMRVYSTFDSVVHINIYCAAPGG